MKKYESVFIIDVRKVDDEGKAFSAELAKYIESLGGKITEAIPMGRKQFAREIKKRKAGAYWNIMFELTSDKVGSIRNKFRLDERVLRLMIILDEKPENYKGSEAKIEIK